jgi:hypothetical protein
MSIYAGLTLEEKANLALGKSYECQEYANCCKRRGDKEGEREWLLRKMDFLLDMQSADKKMGNIY